MIKEIQAGDIPLSFHQVMIRVQIKSVSIVNKQQLEESQTYTYNCYKTILTCWTMQIQPSRLHTMSTLFLWLSFITFLRIFKIQVYTDELSYVICNVSTK